MGSWVPATLASLGGCETRQLQGPVMVQGASTDCCLAQFIILSRVVAEWGPCGVKSGFLWGPSRVRNGEGGTGRRSERAVYVCLGRRVWQERVSAHANAVLGVLVWRPQLDATGTGLGGRFRATHRSLPPMPANPAKAARRHQQKCPTKQYVPSTTTTISL